MHISNLILLPVGVMSHDIVNVFRRSHKTTVSHDIVNGPCLSCRHLRLNSGLRRATRSSMAYGTSLSSRHVACAERR